MLKGVRGASQDETNRRSSLVPPSSDHEQVLGRAGSGSAALGVLSARAPRKLVMTSSVRTARPKGDWESRWALPMSPAWRGPWLDGLQGQGPGGFRPWLRHKDTRGGERDWTPGWEFVLQRVAWGRQRQATVDIQADQAGYATVERTRVPPSRQCVAVGGAYRFEVNVPLTVRGTASAGWLGRGGRGAKLGTFSRICLSASADPPLPSRFQLNGRHHVTAGEIARGEPIWAPAVPVHASGAKWPSRGSLRRCGCSLRGRRTSPALGGDLYCRDPAYDAAHGLTDMQRRGCCSRSWAASSLITGWA